MDICTVAFHWRKQPPSHIRLHRLTVKASITILAQCKTACVESPRAQSHFSTGSGSRETAPCYFYIQRGGLPQPALLIVFSIRLKAMDLLDSYRRFMGYCFEKPVIILLHFVST